MAKTFEQNVATKVASLMVEGAYSVSAVVKLATSIGTRAATLDVDMHSAGVAALGCAMEHKDTSAVVKVANSLGKHTRSKAFAEWVEKFSNVTMALSKKSGLWEAVMVKAEDRKDVEELEALIVAAMADPFWSVAEKSARDFSLALALAQLLKKADAEFKKGTLSDDDRAAVLELQGVADKIKPVAAKVDA